jgi:hypothetical protein
MQVILNTRLPLAICLKIAILYGESLTFCELCTSSLSVSGILHQGSHQSSLIQVTRFSERPCIVPHEVLSGLNVRSRALSPKLSYLFIFLLNKAKIFLQDN